MIRPPAFWRDDGPLPRALHPMGLLYGAVAGWRARAISTRRAPVPVLCIGNLTIGGAGKTPTSIAVALRLRDQGHRPAIVTRGYRGRLTGPVLVDPARHGADDVGDEAIVTSRRIETWLSRDRFAGAVAAHAAGANVVVLDDGLQNPTLAKDASLVVVDGDYGFGNGRILPAGPLRERLEIGLPRARAFVLIGEDRARLSGRLRGHAPVLTARIEPSGDSRRWRDRPVIAFAGIFRPEKFWTTLESLGARLIERHAFADHHRFRPAELESLAARATATGAELVTTEKDLVRLPREWRERVACVRVELRFDDLSALDHVLAGAFGHG
jgi:tetraacyldisaccharide 4'-kinase